MVLWNPTERLYSHRYWCGWSSDISTEHVVYMDIWRFAVESISSTCLRQFTLACGGNPSGRFFNCRSVVDALDASIFTLDGTVELN